MYTKIILCLANSKKTSGRCVAGKELVEDNLGAWVRPISRSPTHEISASDRSYSDGSTAEVMQLIEIPLLGSVPTVHQTENHLIAMRRWRKMGEATWGQVERAIDAVRGSLWLDGHSTQHGINDKVPESELHTIPDSLKLIKVANVRLIVAPEPGFNGRPPKRKVRASFRFNGISYLLALTDPILESEFLGKRNGTYDIGPATLCVSLSEPKFGFAFKLVATVLLKDRF